MPRFFYLTLLSLFLLAGCSAHPLRVDSGDLSGDHYWQGRVDVYGDVLFSEDSRLVIAPGSEIVFHRPGPGQDRWDDHPNFPGSELIIRGELIAAGTATEPILFRAASPQANAGYWGGINISGSPQSRIEYGHFQQADSAVHVQESTVFVENSLFKDNLVGVRFHTSKILIEHNRFQDNDTGVRFHFGAPVICRNVFIRNRRAIFMTSHPADFLIENNSFLDSLEYHFVLGEEVPETIEASGNWWGGDSLQGIYPKLYDGRRENHLGRIQVAPLRSIPDPTAGIQ